MPTRSFNELVQKHVADDPPFARALLRDSPILILDEALSSVDAENEAVIQQAIDRLSAERTTLVLAHRLSSVIGADRILVLDKGRIVETGRHAELIRRDGPYRRLMGAQAEEREDDIDLIEDDPTAAARAQHEYDHQRLRAVSRQRAAPGTDTVQGRGRYLCRARHGLYRAGVARGYRRDRGGYRRHAAHAGADG